MKIARNKTVDDWHALRAQLQSGATRQLWDSAYKEFYRDRIDSRYLDPIASIQGRDVKEGEGFAIVALLCTLVEYLESCEQGVNFRLLSGGAVLGNYEYSPREAAVLFKAFLSNRTPFDALVPSHLVDSFYQDVRCGLLHEARTKGGWEISSKSSEQLVSEGGGKITLFRNAIVPSLEKYFENYRVRLRVNTGTQEALIRKFDHLCGP